MTHGHMVTHKQRKNRCSQNKDSGNTLNHTNKNIFFVANEDSRRIDNNITNTSDDVVNKVVKRMKNSTTSPEHNQQQQTTDDRCLPTPTNDMRKYFMVIYCCVHGLKSPRQVSKITSHDETRTYIPTHKQRKRNKGIIADKTHRFDYVGQNHETTHGKSCQNNMTSEWQNR